MGRNLNYWCYPVIFTTFLGELVKCSGAQQTSRFSVYEVTVPRQITRKKRDLKDQDTEEVSFSIQALGMEHVIVLERNELLLPGDFTVYTYDTNGSLISERPDMQNHCYYRGYVEGIEFSSASVSLCSGLNGFLKTENTTLWIEPLEGSSDFEHVVYSLEDEETEPLRCGSPHTPHHDDDTSSSDQIVFLDSDISGHPASHSLSTHYVELIIVVDNNAYHASGNNESLIQEQMIQVANRLDSMYEPLNIRVVLVGLEIWTAGDLISVDARQPEKILTDFQKWRTENLLPRHHHDNAQFVVKEQFLGAHGLAYMSTICSPKSAGINMYTHISNLSWTMAHELGHSLGMGHDKRDCYCSAKQCVMFGQGKCGNSCDNNVFSSCSVGDFERMVMKLGDSNCLLNMPKPHEIYSKPYCGNKLLELGEECDCGSEEECERDPCCEPKTCKLRSCVQCAYGECCRNCKFLPAGFECRSRSGECDLPEYCNGSSAVCQADVFVQNGNPCRNNQSYCYNGKCQHHDDQCQALFGSNATSAAEICYVVRNCPVNRRCGVRDAKCGKLQCANVNFRSIFRGHGLSVSSSTINGNKCWSVDYKTGPDVFEPGMVNNGTKCGESQVCLNNQCKDISELKSDCDVDCKCHGHGICNSNENCHCDDGWAPPFCKDSGYGGSIDSGPAGDGASRPPRT